MGFMALLILFSESEDVLNVIYVYTTYNNNVVKVEMYKMLLRYNKIRTEGKVRKKDWFASGILLCIYYINN